MAHGLEPPARGLQAGASGATRPLVSARAKEAVPPAVLGRAAAGTATWGWAAAQARRAASTSPMLVEGRPCLERYAHATLPCCVRGAAATRCAPTGLCAAPL